MKQVLIKIDWVCSEQFGINVRRCLNALLELPGFMRSWRSFRKQYAGRMVIVPCLHNRHDKSGATDSEYFWQDLLVARWVHRANPERHVDIGSRVDGFVAHLATFREVEVFDIRPMPTEVPGMSFRQIDFMQAKSLPHIEGGYCDSLSCLHALEHFGLGRYGDPINPNGYALGIANMSRLLKDEGRLYLSVPIGPERVEFNANRIFDPSTIVRCATDNGMRLNHLVLVGPSGVERTIQGNEFGESRLGLDKYKLGIFDFKKTKL